MCGGTAGVSRRLLRRSGKRWNEIEQTKKMMEGIQTQNFTVETATGLIGTLQQQSSDLEKKKLVAQSPDELATINSQLETIQGILG